MALLVGFPGAKATRAIFGRKTHSLRAITLWQRLLVGSVWITRRNHYFAALKIIRGELLGVLIVSLISSHDVLAALFQVVLYDLDLIPDIMRALVQILLRLSGQLLPVQAIKRHHLKELLLRFGVLVDVKCTVQAVEILGLIVRIWMDHEVVNRG